MFADSIYTIDSIYVIVSYPQLQYCIHFPTITDSTKIEH